MSSEKQGTPKRPKSRFNRFLNGAVFFISLGVLGNLYFTWKTTDFGASFRWEEFSPGYLLLAAALAFMPWVTHMLRLTVWARFLKVKASAVELFRIAVACIGWVGHWLTKIAAKRHLLCFAQLLPPKA